MKMLAVLFGISFFGGLLSLWSAPAGDHGRLPFALGVSLIAVALLGWALQLVVEGVDRLLRMRRRKPIRKQ
jgi:hypothetical protein